MNIRVSPEIAALLAAQVSNGRFATLDDAVAQLALDDAAAQAELDQADLGWAHDYVAEGLAEVEAGKVVASDIVHDELRARFFRPNK